MQAFMVRDARAALLTMRVRQLAQPSSEAPRPARRKDGRATSMDAPTHSHDATSPELCNLVAPSPERGRREDRALTAPAAPCAMGRKNAHGFDRYSRDIPAFPAQWFYGLYVLSPGKRPFLPPLPAGLTANVAPGSRRQDHTTSPYASSVFVRHASMPDASRVHRIRANVS